MSIVSEIRKHLNLLGNSLLNIKGLTSKDYENATDKTVYKRKVPLDDGTWKDIDDFNTETEYDVVNADKDGLAPKVTATDITVSTQSEERVLTSVGGATPVWKKLPANAFKDTVPTVPTVNNQTVKFVNWTGLNIDSFTLNQDTDKSITMPTAESVRSFNWNGNTPLDELDSNVLDWGQCNVIFINYTGQTSTPSAPVVMFNNLTKIGINRLYWIYIKSSVHLVLKIAGCYTDSVLHEVMAGKVSKFEVATRLGDDRTKEVFVNHHQLNEYSQSTEDNGDVFVNVTDTDLTDSRGTALRDAVNSYISRYRLNAAVSLEIFTDLRYGDGYFDLQSLSSCGFAPYVLYTLKIRTFGNTLTILNYKNTPGTSGVTFVPSAAGIYTITFYVTATGEVIMVSIVSSSY